MATGFEAEMLIMYHSISQNTCKGIKRLQAGAGFCMEKTHVILILASTTNV